MPTRRRRTITGLTNGTNYTFEVQAFNDGGPSPSSNQASAMPVPPLPRPPTNLTATAGDAQITLVWDAPTTGGPVTAYQYRQSTDAGNHLVRLDRSHGKQLKQP